MTFQLKQGIHGETRDGKKVGPLKRNEAMRGTFFEFSAPGTKTTWGADGRVTDEWNSKADIVAELKQ